MVAPLKPSCPLYPSAVWPCGLCNASLLSPSCTPLAGSAHSAQGLPEAPWAPASHPPWGLEWGLSTGLVPPSIPSHLLSGLLWDEPPSSTFVCQPYNRTAPPPNPCCSQEPLATHGKGRRWSPLLSPEPTSAEAGPGHLGFDDLSALPPAQLLMPECWPPQQGLCFPVSVPSTYLKPLQKVPRKMELKGVYCSATRFEIRGGCTL